MYGPTDVERRVAEAEAVFRSLMGAHVFHGRKIMAEAVVRLMPDGPALRELAVHGLFQLAGVDDEEEEGENSHLRMEHESKR
jgi:hypothetical protein